MDEDAAVDFALRELDLLPVPTRFLPGLRERADRHGTVLILDEVQSGAGRPAREPDSPGARHPDDTATVTSATRLPPDHPMTPVAADRVVAGMVRCSRHSPGAVPITIDAPVDAVFDYA